MSISANWDNPKYLILRVVDVVKRDHTFTVFNIISRNIVSAQYSLAFIAIIILRKHPSPVTSCIIILKQQDMMPI